MILKFTYLLFLRQFTLHHFGFINSLVQPIGKMSPKPPGSTILLAADLKEKRFIELKSAFVEKFKCEPQLFVRVPGRVNLIGEHIDYCGYSVCPMAIQQDILFALCRTDDFSISLSNTDQKHRDFTADIRSFRILEKDDAPPLWHSYVLCGIQSVLESMVPESQPPVGFKALVTGNIPLASGLSSSSALVCSSALSTALSNKLDYNLDQLAVICANAERYIGTQGGGMDQAIVLLANAGYAKHIEFDPLKTTEVQLPCEAVFVIAHSLHSLNKAATSDFNQRVVECRLASMLIAKKKGLTWRKLGKLRNLHTALEVSLPEMENVVLETLHENPYTKNEICNELEVTEEELDSIALGPKVNHIQFFKVYQRALHVFREAYRVIKFCEIMQEDNGILTIQQLGQLMNESHSSLSELYECSHPQLDSLVDMARKHAFGSRLTGAGWGGCTVSLATYSTAQVLVDFLKEEFYKKSHLYKGQDLDSLVFVTAPSSGCRIYDLEQIL